MEFKDLERGQWFDLGIDADGYEPVFYKLSDTEAYQVSGGPHGGGHREQFAPTAEVCAWKDITVLHAAPTEVERAAFALLYVQDTPFVNHLGLESWIQALVANSEEFRSLDQYIWEEGMSEQLSQAGLVCWQRGDRDHSAAGAIYDYQPSGQDPKTAEERRWAYYDEAALRLGNAICQYREAGRPAGDIEHTIMGMGAPLVKVSTSLAAAIGEYHHTMLNLVFSDHDRLARALRDNAPDDLISQTEAAELVGITPQAINNAIRQGRIRSYYTTEDAVSHRPGDRMVSRSEVLRVWQS